MLFSEEKSQSLEDNYCCYPLFYKINYASWPIHKAPPMLS